MKLAGYFAGLFFLLVTQWAGAQSLPARGGRYDRQILDKVLKITGHHEYKNVHVEVEDGIVTLSGTVELESSRVALESRVGRIARVTGVRNELVLDPPAEPDQIVSTRLRVRLVDGGFEEIQMKVHNGAVVLSGTVRNQKERRRVLQIARLTPGVKEVESKLVTASY